MGNKIVSNLFLGISAWKNKSEVINYNALKTLRLILYKLGKPMLTNRDISESNRYLFNNIYVYPKENYENIIHELNKFKACEYPEIDRMELDCLYDYDKLCSIKLDSNAIISDPLYTVERWYSVGYLGRLQNVLPGNYNCFIQKSELGYIANIKVVHEDYDPDKYEPKDIEDCINIRIDSDMCGIFNNEERLIKNRYEKDQYTIIDNNNNNINYLTDGEAFIIQYPGSGYGDESYRCYLSRNTDCQIVGIRVEFINYDEYYEEEK